MINNIQRLNAAVAIALANADFMGDAKKVNKAIEALTPKDDVTRVFKMLQGNALKDYLVNKELGKAADGSQARADWIKNYVTDKFKKHMADPRTATNATKLYNDAYPATTAPEIGSVPADGIADPEKEAA